MNSKKLSTSTSSPETLYFHPANNQIAEIEAKYFCNLEEQDDSIAILVQDDFDRCRIQARGGFDAFLQGTPVGKLLVRYIATDPMETARNRRADNVEQYAHQLLASGIVSTSAEADQYAFSYFNVIPHSHQIAVFQMQLQDILEKDLRPFLEIGSALDLINAYQRIKAELAKRFNFTEEVISKEEGHQLMFREFVWKIKQQIAESLARQDYTRLPALLSHLNALSNQERISLWTYLPLELNQLSQALSKNPQLRKELSDFCLRQMIVNGPQAAEEFQTFLQKIQVKKIEGNELSTYLDYFHIERDLDFSWTRGHKSNYFQAIESLLDIGILNPTYLNSDKVLHRSIEYYLLSFYNGHHQALKKEILPLLIRLGIFPEHQANNPTTNLLKKYDQLCVRLNLDWHETIEEKSQHPPTRKPKS